MSLWLVHHKKNNFLLAMLIFCIAIATQANEYPSQYVGIFDICNDGINGRLKSKKSNYTGSWTFEYANEKMIGNYKGGIPAGTWILFSTMGLPIISSNYDQQNKTYISTTYYLDSVPRLHTIGNYHITPNSFQHEIQRIEYWDPRGNKLQKITTPQTQKWKWTSKELDLFYRQRDGIDAVNTRLVTVITDSETLMVAVYYFTREYFIKKITFLCKINQEDGHLEYQPQSLQGDIPSSLDIKTAKLSSDQVQSDIVLGTIHEKNKIEMTIPFITEINKNKQ